MSGRDRGGRPRVLEDRPLTGAERKRRSRENLKGQPVPANVKHGIYGWKVYRCKCEVCQKAFRRYNHRQKNPWMYRDDLRGRWRERDGGQITVLCWPPRDAGSDWKCECEVAA